MKILEHDVALALLALRLSGGRRAEQIWQILATHPDPDGVAVELARSLRPEAHKQAKQQLALLPLFDITMVPVWRLPPRLQKVRPTPPVLFVRGDVTLLYRPAISLVGTRHSHATAVAWTHARALELARAETLVVSGGARGIDTAAHRGALDGKGVTVAYLGVAADAVYPPGNKALFERILNRNGALVMEHPPGVLTYKGEHALRNRFIAAHASHLVVVEADLESGALVTADFAERLGVPTWVSPPGVGLLRAGLELLLHSGRARIWGSGEEA